MMEHNPEKENCPQEPQENSTENKNKVKLKPCPFCREDIKDNALLCKHCQSDLSRIKLNDYNEYVKLCASCYSENELNAIRCETCGDSLVIVADKEIKSHAEEEIEQREKERKWQFEIEQKKKEEELQLPKIIVNFIVPGLGTSIFEKRFSRVLIAYLAWIVIAIILSIATLGCFLVIWLIIEIGIRCLLVWLVTEMF